MRDVFAEVVPLCRRAQDLIQEVFTAPDQVMTKFVINIYQGQLKVDSSLTEHIYQEELKVDNSNTHHIYQGQLRVDTISIHNVQLKVETICDYHG